MPDSTARFDAPRGAVLRIVVMHAVIALALIAGTVGPSLAQARPVTPLPPVEPREPTIGIADAFLESEMAWNAGARWQRILFYWDAFQPDWNGQWQANRYVSDAVLKNELDRGFKLVGVIGNPPRWATGEGSVPLNLNLSLDNPNNNWARFVRQLATTYAGRVDTWIIWNEPDIRPGRPGSTWNGSEADYWLLLKTASKTIKAANPRATVAIAGTTYWADAQDGRKLFLERVLDVAARDPEAAANGYFFDAVPFHIYSSPYKVYEVAQSYRQILRRFGLDKPLWLTETNVVPYDDPHAKVPRSGARGTLEEQASFVIETVALARAAGVERIQLYKMTDGPIEAGEPYGLVRNDRTPRPAYVALQVASRYLLAEGSRSFTVKDGVARVTFDAGRRRTSVVWAVNPVSTPARLEPRGTTATAIDKTGQSRALPISSSQPTYDLMLAPATANTAGNALDYIIGGNPIIVVEDGIGDAVAGSPTSLFFPITGMNVVGPRLDYFRRRGELATFGYPISRPFRLLGHDIQLFQRQAIELMPDGRVGTLNLLDDEFLPYTRFNGAVIPARDSELIKSAPTPGAKDYDAAIQRWIAAHAPDRWDGLPVRFHSAFERTVSLATAFPDGHGKPELLPGLNLELWGVPTSAPARDPTNRDFVYLRFQRGVMHFDAATGATQGLLLAAYLKAILTGEELPADLDAQARGQPLYRQYDRAQPRAIARPAALPESDLTDAFEREPLRR